MHEDGGGKDAQEPQSLEQTHVHPFPPLRVFQSSLFIYLEDISCQKKGHHLIHHPLSHLDSSAQKDNHCRGGAPPKITVSRSLVLKTMTPKNVNHQSCVENLQPGSEALLEVREAQVWVSGRGRRRH